MKPKIVAFPLASKVHEREYYTRILSSYKSSLMSLGVKFCKTIFDEKQIDEKHDIDLALILFLTGGTGRIGYKLGLKLNCPIVLIAHGFHNSLPSALSANFKLKIRGKRVKIIFTERPFDVVNRVNSLVKGLIALRSLKDLKIAVISDEINDEIRQFIRRFKALVKHISYKEIEEETKAIKRSEVEEKYHKIKRKINIEETERKSLWECIEVYIAIKRIVKKNKLNAVAIDCFPFISKFSVTPCLALSLLNSEGIIGICEADFKALTLMAIAKKLTNQVGWIGNLSSVDDKGIALAHCTASLNLISDARLVPHFETKSPYAVTGLFRNKEFTLVGLSYGYRIMAVKKVRLIESGLLSEDRCRMQVVLSLKPLKSDLLNKLVCNHHVLMVGDVREEIKDIAWLAGIKILEY